MNTIYLRRRNKVLLPPPAGEGELLPLHYVATALKNIDSRSAKSLVHLFKQKNVVFDVRKLTHDFVVGDVPAFIQALRQAHHLLRAQAQLAPGFLLQG